MTRKILLLASYCGDDDPSCTDDLPCLECLKMCNIVDQQAGDVTGNLGGYHYNRALRETGLPRNEAVAKLQRTILDDMERARQAIMDGAP